MQIIDFKADLDAKRFENLGQSECNLQDISAPLQEAVDLCYARFKNEAAEKGAHYVMINPRVDSNIWCHYGKWRKVYHQALHEWTLCKRQAEIDLG